MTKGNGSALALLFICIATGGSALPFIGLLWLVAEVAGPNKK